MIYLDANVIIRLVEGDAAAREPIQRRLSGQGVLLTSQFSRLECRSKPMRDNDVMLLGLYDRFFSSQELRLIDIDHRVIDAATTVRAIHGFKSPDAIHLAAAVVAQATGFLTGDAQLLRFSPLPVELI